MGEGEQGDKRGTRAEREIREREYRKGGQGERDREEERERQEEEIPLTDKACADTSPDGGDVMFPIVSSHFLS